MNLYTYIYYRSFRKNFSTIRKAYASSRLIGTHETTHNCTINLNKNICICSYYRSILKKVSTIRRTDATNRDNAMQETIHNHTKNKINVLNFKYDCMHLYVYVIVRLVGTQAPYARLVNLAELSKYHISKKYVQIRKS